MRAVRSFPAVISRVPLSFVSYSTSVAAQRVIQDRKRKEGAKQYQRENRFFVATEDGAVPSGQLE